MVAMPVLPGVAGIGLDILRVDRVTQTYARYGQKFVNRILGPEEIAIFQRRFARDPQRGIRFLATRFAAKEAFSKAIGLGMRSPMSWPLMQTLNQPSGKPGVQLTEPLASWYAQRFGEAHVSVTDESDLVAAFVVVNPLSSSNPSTTAITS